MPDFFKRQIYDTLTKVYFIYRYVILKMTSYFVLCMQIGILKSKVLQHKPVQACNRM